MDIRNEMKVVITVVSSATFWLIGAWDMVLGILATVIVCDYISGVLYAIKTKTLSSQVGRAGLMKKAATLLVVVVAHQVDVALGNTEDIVRNITALFYISNELLSILENAGNIGIPLPKVLVDVCEKIGKKDGE
ncbi:MAG: phage holin family protein [Clostridia bacterium]|nr:phage holin family protein [Clostridia bacterium]